MRAASTAAFLAASTPTLATGTPGGICVIASSASRPPPTELLEVRRDADHRQLGVSSDHAGQRSAQAGAGDDHAQPAHARVPGVVGDDVGVVVRRHNAHLAADPALGQFLLGLLHRWQVALGGHHDAHQRSIDGKLLEHGLRLQRRHPATTFSAMSRRSCRPSKSIASAAT